MGSGGSTQVWSSSSDSQFPDLYVDSAGIIHIVWVEGTPGDIYYITGTVEATGGIVFASSPTRTGTTHVVASIVSQPCALSPSV